MSHTSRRGPPIECPLASLGRNTPSMDTTQTYHHPLSSSPLNPQVYQMSRKSPLLSITDDIIYTSTRNNSNSNDSTNKSNECTEYLQLYNNIPPSRQNSKLTQSSSASTSSSPDDYNKQSIVQPSLRNYTPLDSIIQYHDRLSPVDEHSHHYQSNSYCHQQLTNDSIRNNNNVTNNSSHNNSDQYYLENKLNSLYIHDVIRNHPTNNSERYYLEENMDNMCSYPSSNGHEDYLLRASSPSETSGSDRYFISRGARQSPAGTNNNTIISGGVSSYGGQHNMLIHHHHQNHHKSSSQSSITSTTNTTNLVDGLTRLGRFSPSLDQGYATLVSPSPSGGGQHTPGPWNKNKGPCRSGPGFDRLPDEAIVKIFQWLNSSELSNLSKVCRRFESLVWKPILWRAITLKGESICGDKALKAIFRRLCGQTRNGSCPDVERVMLNDGCRVTDKGLQLLGRRCPELTHLQIQFSSTVTNQTLFEMIGKCTNLQHLDITGCSLITTLNIHPAYDPSRRLLLQYLDLTDCCSINDSGLKTIVKNCPQLVYLYLRRCVQLTDGGLKFVPSFCVALRELSVSDCCGITDFGLYELAKLGATLRYLSVAKCDRVSDAGLKVIARRCYKLRYLNARGCEAVSDDSITVLARSCPRLRALDIGKCDVSDAGLRALAESCPNLKKISLRNCDMITDRGVQCIAYYCRGLQQLNIQDCQVSLEGYRAVKKYCKRCVIEHTNPGFC